MNVFENKELRITQALINHKRASLFKVGDTVRIGKHTATYESEDAAFVAMSYEDITINAQRYGVSITKQSDNEENLNLSKIPYNSRNHNICITFKVV